jgi:hypothetical protein
MNMLRKFPLRAWAAEALIVLLALIALRKGNPYGYYIFLRWAACPLFAWIAWKAFDRYKNVVLAVAAGLLALLYNPIVRVSMERDRWEIINMGMIAVALWSVVQELLATTQSDNVDCEK